MGIPYYGISSGKLRRYLNLKNLSDPFRVLKGIGEAKKILKKLRPDIIFSKGGFVAVPVVLAARRRRIPVIIHESDMTPGLANKLCIPTAVKVCCNFPETAAALPADKAVVTGSPIRQELMQGNKLEALKFCGFTANKPVILVIGGSLGSVVVNDAVREILPELLKTFQVIHLCGKDKLDPSLEGTEGYVQYEYIRKELADLFALADLVISRAGANAICEISALAKPNLLIPLSPRQAAAIRFSTPVPSRSRATAWSWKRRAERQKPSGEHPEAVRKPRNLHCGHARQQPDGLHRDDCFPDPGIWAGKIRTPPPAEDSSEQLLQFFSEPGSAASFWHGWCLTLR